MSTAPEPIICELCKKVHPGTDSSKCDTWCEHPKELKESEDKK